MDSEQVKQMDKTPDTSYDSRESLLAHKIYPTPQRLAIADMLLAKHQHMTAEQIYETMRSYQNKVSQATVYNTLGLFVEKGLLHEIFIDSSKTFYDTNIKPHQHFYNVDTGQITDINKPLPPSFIQDELPSNTQIESIHLVVRVENA